MSKLDNFKFSRWFKGLNRTVQITLCTSLWIALNYIAANQFDRFDLTKSHRYSLGPETLAYIDTLKEPVTIYVTHPPESAQEDIKIIFEDIRQLLREYEYAGRKGDFKKITVEYIDIYKERAKAQLLVSRYSVNPKQEYALIVTSGDRFREIDGTALYSVDENEVSQFRGEQAFTSAILNIASPEKPKIYWLAGHGEMQLADVDPVSGLSVVSQFLTERNFEMASLDLSKEPGVPEDADLLIIAAPETTILPFEVEKLRRYLRDDNGRMICFLQPARVHGLDDLLWEWGILADDKLILDTSQEFIANQGDLLISDFSDHPITKYLRVGEMRVLFGLSRSIRPDPGAPFDESLTTAPLLVSSQSSWAETSYRDGTSMQYDPAIDLPGPVSLATVSQRTAGNELGLNIPGGRLTVLGNADFIGNKRIHSAGNKIFFNNLINWSLDNNTLLEIPPRPIDQFQLPLDNEDLQSIFLRMLLLPGCVAAFGLFTYVLRRK